MARLTESITIAAPVEKVFLRCDDPHAMPLYVPSVTSVSDVKRSEKRLGDTFRVTYGMLGSHFDEDFTYTEYERNKKIKASFDGAMKGTMGITLEPHGGSTKATRASLGVGFTIMHEVADGLYLCTGPAGTTLIIEMAVEPEKELLRAESVRK